MKVLIGCEFSGRIRDSFIEKGHDALSCDLLPTEKEGKHYQGDIRDILYSEKWDLGIFHPDCTYLTNAASRYLYPNGILNENRYNKGLEAKEFFMLFYNLKHIPKVCIENPLPSKIFNLPKYTQIIQPYFFGEAESKRTCLWLKNLPELKPTNIVKPKIYGYYKTGKNVGKPIYGNNYLKFSNDRGHIRSITFKSIADAMSNQWG